MACDQPVSPTTGHDMSINARKVEPTVVHTSCIKAPTGQAVNYWDESEGPEWDPPARALKGGDRERD